MEAGVLLARDGLQPSSGSSVAPTAAPTTTKLKIRQVFEMEDFAPILFEKQVQHKVELQAELTNQTADK
jgi:hypothetical protein